MKIGLMGGSFDPVHFGHLRAARDAMDQYALDRLILVPAAQTPRKSGITKTSGHHRMAMLQAAIGDDDRLKVSDFEVSQGGVSYTINTVRYFREQFPTDELFWIIGADQVPLLDQWRSIDEVVKMVEFIYLARPGHPTAARLATSGLTLHRCEGRSTNISSTELRGCIQQRKFVDEFVPRAVAVYIEQYDLYQ